MLILLVLVAVLFFVIGIIVGYVYARKRFDIALKCISKCTADNKEMIDRLAELEEIFQDGGYDEEERC